MKKYKFSALALLGVLAFNTGCDKDLLDQTNPNRPSTGQFWKTESDATRAMIAAYSRQQIFTNYSLFWHFATEGRSDESFTNTPDPGLNQYLVFRQVNTSDARSQFMWNDMYSIVFRCNQILTNVPGITMDETLKKQTLAEALFLRSLAYYDLGLLFGNIPLVLTVADATTRVTQVPQDEVYKQIITDLTAAKADLPLTYDAANRGRATRGAATALMGKVYMQMDKQLHPDKWTLASAQFAEVINSNTYSLVANYSDNFTEANENNAESVYEVQFSSVNKSTAQDAVGGTEGNERAQFWGPPGIGYTDVETRRWVFDEFTDRTTTGGIDPRRDVTMFSAVGTPTLYGKTFVGVGPNSLNINPNRILWRKYQNDRTRNFEDLFSGINIRLIRYADVLLMHAEALNEQNQTVAAVPFINQVRTRANLAPLVAGTFNQATLRTQLRHERVTELAGEGTRWSDLIRYELLDTPAGLNEVKARDADFNNFIIPKNKLLPIPQTDIDVDRTLKQNPGF